MHDFNFELYIVLQTDFTILDKNNLLDAFKYF